MASNKKARNNLRNSESPSDSLTSPCLSSRKFSIREVAEMMEVSMNTVRNWIKFGCRGRKLEAYRVGHAYRVSEDQLERFVEPENQEGATKHVSRSHEDTLAALRAMGLKV